MIPLIGYTDRLSGRPGDSIEFKVSSAHNAPYDAGLVRIVCADPNPDGPGLIEEPVASGLNGAYPSRVQPFYPGSYGSAAVAGLFPVGGGFSLVATIWPTTPAKAEGQAEAQGILSCRNTASGDRVALFIHPDGACGASLTAADGQVITACSGEKLKARRWYRVWASYDPANGLLRVAQQGLYDSRAAASGNAEVTQPPALAQVDQVLIAALHADSGTGTGSTPARGHFNGKIESPMILDHPLDESRAGWRGDELPDGRLAHWDFSQEISSTRIRDTGPGQFHGVLVNFPARAMTGCNWDAEEMCWRHAPAQYGAIHFHDDDIYDFGWETDFRFTIPEDFPSGVYGVRIQCGDDYDVMPFFVCPPRGKPSARLCVLVSTFTYTVYGNHARPNFAPAWLERIKAWGAYPWNPALHRDYGLSTYNFHTDGSGICHASHRRPLLTLRPGYLTFGEGHGSGLRHFQADSHLITWLEQNAIDYDLITDQELHDEGVAAIAGYRAVTTGSHPEYHTAQTLDALQAYRARGGNFMYLGGNGFYWKVALHPEANGAIEIRRAESGIRAWAAEPGEYYQAFDGGYGGLWRRNNRPPQQLAGVGFSAQGGFSGSYYRRRPQTFTDPQIAWIFEGIDESIIGDFGLSGGGAAGFELDRADPRLGSPENLRLLAVSENHDHTFVLVPEEQLTHLTTWPGEPVADLIRADLIYQVNDNGGQLFATGSITFCGSLLCNNGDNNISRLLLNVVKGFTRHGNVRD